MNHINNIEIKNFKSIRHQKIDDCRRINVFIGYPNVGKSNILEALSGFSLLSSKTFTGYTLKSIIRFSRFTDLFFNATTTEPIIVTLNNEDILLYSLANFEELKVFITGLSKGTTVKDGPVGVRRGQTYLTSSVNKEGQFLSKELIDFDSTGTPLIKKYVFNSNISFQSSKSLFLNIPFGENLNDIVEIIPTLRRECNEILKEYGLNLHFDRTISGNKLELRKNLSDGTTITLEWSLIADTLRRLFFYKAAILNNKNSVLLFEEPEAHMFPPYVKKFTSDVIFDETNQFFIATHSPYVLSEFIEEASEELAVFVVDYDKGETVIKRLTENEIIEVAQYGIDLFFNLESYLDKNVQPHSA